MIKRSVLQLIGINDCRIEKVFDSKKNHVMLASAVVDDIEKRFVVKKFSNPESADKENHMLKILNERGVPVPELFAFDNTTIIMEHIGGETFLDRISLLEEEFDSIEDEVCSLSEYLKLFYDATKKSDSNIILKDVNLRNFILADRVYGIDFEDCGAGLPEEDAGRLCAYFISYRPEFSKWKMDMAPILFNILCSNLSLNRERAKHELFNELELIKMRRKLCIPGYVSKMTDNL